MPQSKLLGGPLPARGSDESPTSTPRRHAHSTSVLSGSDCLAQLGGELDHLCEQSRIPITARRAWLETWADVHPEEQVLVVVVRRDDVLVAAAPLARRRRCGVTVVRPLGDGPSDDVRFPALDPQAAAQLAAGVQQALDRLSGPWVLVLRNLGADDLVLPVLQATMRFSSSIGGEACPGLRLNADRTLRAHVPASQRKAVQRRQRRLAERQGEPHVEHLTDPAMLLAVLPEVEHVCRRRDAAVGRPTQMDDPVFRSFFRLLVSRLAPRGELELTTVRIDGALVGYALCLLDGPARRLWHGRFDPAWESYSIGHVVNFAALQRALDDPTCDYFDWMRGEEEYKSSLSNERVQLSHLVAASGSLRWTVVAMPTARRLVRVLRRHRQVVTVQRRPAADDRQRRGGAVGAPCPPA